ncbi:hypothetical protein [Salinibacter grassmerensis]|uniref:hypothetical protein n=1 Tax=Salinibacter grassmerensis TaxID=3040353 RepID=UPI0021E91536|nr:hypothetical protein [Salinibacter grassmerensis]
MSDLSPDDASRNRGRTDKSLEDEVRSDDVEEATVRYTLDLAKSLHKRLKRQALMEEERSMKAVTTEAIEDYLRKHE